MPKTKYARKERPTPNSYVLERMVENSSDQGDYPSSVILRDVQDKERIGRENYKRMIISCIFSSVSYFQNNLMIIS